MTAPRILAIDAASRMGWAYGPAGLAPRSGSFDCAKKGASRGAVFSGAGRWITKFLQSDDVDLLVIESPMIAGGPMPKATSEILQGLPAVLEFMAFQLGVYQHRRVAVNSVRKHFLGSGRAEDSKLKTFQKCCALGWIDKEDDDQSFDRSDALAIWSYAETEFAPRLAQPVDGLFLKAGGQR